jgi:hypothetical protein
VKDDRGPLWVDRRAPEEQRLELLRDVLLSASNADRSLEMDGQKRGKRGET